jgi:hypothetical protein
MLKLLSGILVVVAMAGCVKDATVSPGGGTTFKLATDSAYTPSGPAPTAQQSDSVVVMGGQQCVATVREILPATNPPKYRVVITCR